MTIHDYIGKHGLTQRNARQKDNRAVEIGLAASRVSGLAPTPADRLEHR